jgi:hypothetical protein
VAWWAALMSLWLLLVDTVAMAELLAGAGAAALGATLVEVVEHQAGVRFGVRVDWLAEVAGLPREILRDTLLVLRAGLIRALGGPRPASSLRVIPVDPGGGSSEDVARRALITAGRSLAPNSIVLGIDASEGLLLVHHLVPPRPAQPGERRVARR